MRRERTCSPSRVAQVCGDGANEPDPPAVQADAFATAATTAFTNEIKDRCRGWCHINRKIGTLILDVQKRRYNHHDGLFNANVESPEADPPCLRPAATFLLRRQEQQLQQQQQQQHLISAPSSTRQHAPRQTCHSFALRWLLTSAEPA